MARRLHLASHSSVAEFEAGHRIPHADLLAGYEKAFLLPHGALQHLRNRALAEQAVVSTENTAERFGTHPVWEVGGRQPMPSPRPFAPNQLPPDLLFFVGRQQEILHVTECAPRLVGIFGAPGTGKTALAVHLANLAPAGLSALPEGQLFIDLQGDSTRALTPAAALTKLLRALGVPSGEIPSGIEEKVALYRSVTTGRRLVIVLDNALDELQVRPLLPASDTCQVFLTARRALHGLLLNAVLRLDRLSAQESRMLLLHASGRPELDRDPGLESVLEFCHGHPLAITVAAARLAARPQWPASRLATLLGESDRVLSHFVSGDLGVRVGFARTYRLLTESQQRLYRRATLLRERPIDAAAAAALLACPLAEAEETLGRLVDVHLLTTHGETTYWLGGLSGAFAAECLADEEGSEERRRTMYRLNGWYMASAAAAHAALTGADTIPRAAGEAPPPAPTAAPAAKGPSCDAPRFATRTRALQWCETHRAYLVELVSRLGAQGRHAEAAAVCVDLAAYFQASKHWADWITVHRIGISCARLARDADDECALTHSLGEAYLELGLLDHARGCLEAALRAAAALPESHRTGLCLTSLGLTRLLQGDLPSAARTMLRALRITRACGERRSLALALCGWGRLLVAQGRAREAVGVLEEARAVLQPDGTGTRPGTGCVLFHLADAHLRCGDVEAAAQLYEQSAAACRDVGDGYGEARAYAWLGDCRQRLLDFDAAHDSLLRAHTLGAEYQRRAIDANRALARSPSGLPVERSLAAHRDRAAGGRRGVVTGLAGVFGRGSDRNPLRIGA